MRLYLFITFVYPASAEGFPDRLGKRRLTHSRKGPIYSKMPNEERSSLLLCIDLGKGSPKQI
jgi:hypothetical protein